MEATTTSQLAAAELARDALVEELRRSEQLFHGAFDASPTGIAIGAADGMTYVDVNQALCNMVGYSKEELMSLGWLAITHPDDRARNLAEVEGLFNGRKEVQHLTKRYIRKDGEVIFVEISDAIIRAPDGSTMYFVTHVTDVTGKEKLQSELRQAQKMEAVGQLAGGIAHDFNNILAVILNYAGFLSEGLTPEDPRRADIREIVKAGEKAAGLVQQLLAFSRKEVVTPRVINLNDVVTGMNELLRTSLGESIHLVLEPTEPLPHVEVDPGRIEQVLINLAVNGREAMPAGGELVISTTTEVVSEGARPGLPAGKYVLLSVRDNGKGMDAMTAEHVFEPFFTTKGRAESPGMGLATVYGIVKQADGFVYVDSSPSGGTTFSIYLPECGHEVTGTSEAPVVDPLGGREAIVLVEDEEAVRRLVSRILMNGGYDVVSFSGAVKALEFLQQNIEGVTLLLTDVVMPDLSGKALSVEATALNAKLKTMYMSGYTDELIARHGFLEAGPNLIRKPFRAQELLGKVRAVLDGPRSD